MKKTIITTYALLVFGGALFSQDYMRIVDSMRGAKFSAITAEIDRCYSDKDKGKGSGYKQYQRWKHFNSTCLDENGYLINVSLENWKTFLDNQEKSAKYKSSSLFHGNWNSFGADKYEYLEEGYSGGNGRVNAVMVDPANSDIIYVGTPAGGLFRTTDEGTTWTSLTDGMIHLGASWVAIDPSSPVNNRTLYFLSGDSDELNTRCLGVFKSIDNGATWMSTGLNWELNDFMNGHKLIMHPSNYNTLFVCTSKNIYKTTDGGISWSPVASGEFRDIEFNTGNPDIMYASTRNGKIYRTTDGGDTWTEVFSHIYARVALAVTPANPDYVYALYGIATGNGQFAGLYLSTDGGITFTLQANTPNILGRYSDGSDSNHQGAYDLALAVSPTDENEVHTGGINTWKSTDAGVTFNNTSFWIETSAGEGNYTHGDIHDLNFYGNNIYCGSDGGVFLSRNNGEDWINISAGLEITQFYKIGGSEIQPSVVLGGAQDNGLIKITNKTMYQWYGGDGFESIADPTDPNTYYGVTQYGKVRKTTNNGSTVQWIKPKDAGSGAWSTPFVMHPTDNQTLYAGYADIWQTTNGGRPWNNISNGQTGTKKASWIAVAPSNDDYIYVSKLDQVYKTTDGGTTWTNISSSVKSFGIINYFVIHPIDPNTLWLAAGKDVWKTTDGGSNWTEITYNLPNYYKRCIVHQKGSVNNRIFVGLDAGVYYLDDNSTEWVDFSNGLVNVMVRELEINYTVNKIRAATFGRGIWESDIIMDCQDSITLNEIHYGENLFQARTITSSSTVALNADIVYLASERIELKRGFKSLKPSRFNAKIGDIDCGPNKIELKNGCKPLKGTYAGPMPGVIENKGVAINDGIASSTENFSFYPNPASSNITLSFTVNSEQPVNIVIMDMLGSIKDMVVSNKFLSKGEYEITHSLNNLDKGVYIVNYTNGTQSSTKQIVITK